MKITLTIAALVTLAVGLAAGWNDRIDVMNLAAIASATFLFVANLDRIAEIKATVTGLEARTREVLTEAENTVSELQTLAQLVGRATLSLVIRSGRLGGYPDDEAEEIRSDVLDVLENIGLSEQGLASAQTDWFRFTEFDYVHYVLGGSTVPESEDHEVIQEWKSLRKYGRVPTPGKLREYLDRGRLLTAEVEERLTDY